MGQSAKKSLVIVESPTKAKTIGKILSSKYTIVSSMGHIIDLPQKRLGIDIDDNFAPTYVIMPSRKKVFAEIKKNVSSADTVYLATDPDREGEAIGWHLREQIDEKSKTKKEFLRVVFHEITPEAIKNAFANPVTLNMNLVNAQQARRILDRLVGYLLSPLLWRAIVRGLSAGRVQSIALKFIVDRERAIKSFIPREYWEIEAELRKRDHDGAASCRSFKAKLVRIKEQKIEIAKEAEAYNFVSELKSRVFEVAEVQEKKKARNPLAPFVTSTLQQESFNKLRFTSSKTMMIAQELYEGIDLGEEGPVGMITYMRTDSPKVADSAVAEVRKHIVSQFGSEYLPDSPNTFKVKKSAQEAHEAIRPTSVARSPDSVKNYLTPDQFRLYELIYRRFVASQMKPASFLSVTAFISAGDYQFSATGSNLLFDGFLAAYKVEDEEIDESKILPPLSKGEILDLIKLDPSQHFTKPPARFSESSLVKLLEEEGIGRPSTYASIIQTIVYRDYVRRQKGYFFATELGMKVADLLVHYFPGIMDAKFTAQMEDELDAIEEGSVEYPQLLRNFYDKFKENLDFAQANLKKETVTVDEKCDVCGKPMVIKWGRKGKFLSCSGYPACKKSKSITTGVKCPEAGCGGELVERHSSRGVFYGCSNFPKCRHISNKLPESTAKDEGSGESGAQDQA